MRTRIRDPLRSRSAQGSRQRTGRCPGAPPPPPTSSGIGYLGLGGGPKSRIKLGVVGAGCFAFGEAGTGGVFPGCAQVVSSRALSLRPRGSSQLPFQTRLLPRDPRLRLFCKKTKSGPRCLASVRARSARWPRAAGQGVETRAGRDPGGVRGLQEAGAAAPRAPARRGERHPETDSSWVPARGGRLAGSGRSGRSRRAGGC